MCVVIRLRVTDLLSAFALLMLYFSGYKFLCLILQFGEGAELQRKETKQRRVGLKSSVKMDVQMNNVNFAATNVYLADALVQCGDQFFRDHVDKFDARRL